ncbi:trypsin-like serine protease [Ramicandelaber brevisporus]|nr:trypsin-like serine protease [Ramicandelaber brevisporus]
MHLRLFKLATTLLALLVLSVITSSGLANTAKLNKRLAGGAIVGNFTESPFVISLLVTMWLTNGSSVVFQCGGAILSADYFLTSAACVYNKNISSYSNVSDTTVYYGSASSSKGSSTTASKYKYFSLTSTPDLDGYIDDFVIGKVSSPFVFGPNVQPIKLSSSHVPDNTTVTTFGWGMAARKGNTASTLNYGIVKVAPDAQCKAASVNMPGTYSDRDSGRFICTSNTQGIGVCGGDTGSPLIYKEQGKYVLLGLTSFRDWSDSRTMAECGEANTWDFYIRPAYWIDGIAQFTGLNKNDFVAPVVAVDGVNNGGGGLSTGAVIGISLGSAAFIIISFVVYWFCIRKKPKPEEGVLLEDKPQIPFPVPSPPPPPRPSMHGETLYYQPVQYINQPRLGIYVPPTGYVPSTYVTSPTVMSPVESYYNGVNTTTAVYTNPYAVMHSLPPTYSMAVNPPTNATHDHGFRVATSAVNTPPTNAAPS